MLPKTRGDNLENFPQPHTRVTFSLDSHKRFLSILPAAQAVLHRPLPASWFQSHRFLAFFIETLHSLQQLLLWLFRCCITNYFTNLRFKNSNLLFFVTPWVDLACVLLFIQCLLGLELQRGGNRGVSSTGSLTCPVPAWVGAAEEPDSAGLLARLAVLPAGGSLRATSFPQGLPIRVARLLSAGSRVNGTFVPMAHWVPVRLYWVQCLLATNKRSHRRRTAVLL